MTYRVTISARIIASVDVQVQAPNPNEAESEARYIVEQEIIRAQQAQRAHQFRPDPFDWRVEDVRTMDLDPESLYVDGVEEIEQ